MTPTRALRLTIVSLVAGTATAGRADTFGALVSNPFTVAYLAAGLGLPLLRDGSAGKDRALRTLDSLAVTFGLTEGLKSLVPERRPDGSDRQSFPSAHTSTAFAVATMQSQFHPKEAPYWYAGATLIGVARVTEHKHFTHDVVAGAALGFGVSRLELSLRRGLLLQPFYSGQGRVGMMLSGRF